MKAQINGITVEGTPEEIFDLMCRSGDAGSLRNKKEQESPFDLMVKVSGGHSARCAFPCNCTGACGGKTQEKATIYDWDSSKT